jgi:type III pantothenate kinase
MNLCVDIGNSQLKMGGYNQAGELLGVVRSEVWDEQRLVEQLQTWKIRRAIVSSVRGQDQKLVQLLQTALESVYLLSAELALPIVNAYATPTTLGNDRLAVAVAAASLYPHQNALVVDAGTCITYDFVTAAGEYLGGSILPGIEMRFRAMHEFTAKLPLVERAALPSFIGNSTQTSLQTGVLYGVLHELEGFANQYRQEFGPIVILVTGGSLPYFDSQLKSRIFAHPNLVLDGLNAILQYQDNN